jgi:hypothetical protein
MTDVFQQNPINTSTYLGDDGTSMSFFDHIVARQVVAMYEEGVGPVSLGLGASSNVDIKAVSNVRSYVGSGGSFEQYIVGTSSGQQDRLALRVAASDSRTIALTTACNLTIGNGNQVDVNGLVFRRSNDAMTLSTLQKDGVRIESDAAVAGSLAVSGNAVTSGSWTVGGDVDVQNNMVVHGELFAQGSVNLWKDRGAATATSNVERVGYGFAIADNDQLELVRYVRLTDSNVVTQRMMRFGRSMGGFSNASSDVLYTKFDVLNGHVITQTGSNTSGSVGDGVVGVQNFWGVSSSGNVFFTQGNVGIGTSNPQYPLDCAGTGRFERVTATAYNTVSDKRLKTVTAALDPAQCLDKINALDLVRYKFGSDAPEGMDRVGVLAQDVEAVIPEAVARYPDRGLADCLHVDADALLYHLIGAVQRLSQLATAASA